jgi:hypothetical protein
MAKSDVIESKKKEANDDEIVDRSHTVTPDPKDDKPGPKIGEVEPGAEDVDASPKKRRDDTGPMSVGVDFNETGE